MRVAVGSGAPVYVMEGEKDVDRAARLGLAATCNAMGALSFRPEHAEQLRGAARVVIVADRDATGYKHAQRVAELLDGLVGTVQVVEAVAGKDFSDHCDAGHVVADLAVIDPAQRLAALTTAATSSPTATEGTTMTAAVEQTDPTITLYTKPDCQQCDATKRALTKLGHRVGETYRVVDVTEDDAALERIKGLGYLQAPVVVAGDVHFSGFRPDRLKALPAPSTPDREQDAAGEERAVSRPGFRNVGGMTIPDYVSRDLASVQDWAAPFLRSAAQRGTIPPLGSQEWVQLPHNDPRKTGAVVEAALQRVREIASIPENVRFDLAMTPDPEKQTSLDVLDAMKEQYALQHPDFDGSEESLNRLKDSWQPKPRPTFAELQRARWGDRAEEMTAAERKYAAERAAGPLNWSPADVADLVEQTHRDLDRPGALPVTGHSNGRVNGRSH